MLLLHTSTQKALLYRIILPVYALQVFETVCLPVVEAALEGFNGTVFAYGQTGSGKTFTMSGGSERYMDRGIIPRAVAHLYDHIGTANGVTTKVRPSTAQNS